MTPQQANELLPCPHCGKTEPARICRSSEDEDWDSSNPDCYGVVCDASNESGIGPGGCGASGGYFEGKYQAIAAWNRRAPAPTEPAVDREPVAALTDKGRFVKWHPEYASEPWSGKGYVPLYLATPASPAVPGKGE